MSATLWASNGNEKIPIVSLLFCRQGFFFDFTPQLVRNSSFIEYFRKGPTYINIWNLTKFRTPYKLCVTSLATAKRAIFLQNILWKVVANLILNDVPSKSFFFSKYWLFKMRIFRHSHWSVRDKATSKRELQKGDANAKKH